MPQFVVKISKGKRITIPTGFCDEFQVDEGDYLLIQWDKGTIPPIIAPAIITPRM